MNKKIKLGTTRVVEVKKDMDIEVTIKIAGRGLKAIKLQQTIVHRLASIQDGEGIKEVEDVFIRNADVIEETESYLIVKHVNFPLSCRVIEEVKEETAAPVVKKEAVDEPVTVVEAEEAECYEVPGEVVAKKFEYKEEIGYVGATYNNTNKHCRDCKNIIEKRCGYNDCQLMWKKDRNEVSKGGVCRFYNMTLEEARRAK